MTEPYHNNPCPSCGFGGGGGRYDLCDTCERKDNTHLVGKLRRERIKWVYYSNPPRKVAEAAGLINPDGPAAADLIEAQAAALASALAKARGEA
jgi:hypothetical protein